METVKLKEILTDEHIVKVSEFMSRNDWKGLKKYLNTLKKQLELYGVLPDYLYYWLKSPDRVTKLINKMGEDYEKRY